MRTRLLSKLSALVAALAIFPLIALVLRRATPIPYWDEWEWTDLIYAAHTHVLTFAALWNPHAEHRMLVPNAIMLALDATGGWNVVREQFVSLILLALTQLGVWALVRRTVSPGIAGWCFLAVTVLLLSIAQWENLNWGFQMAWFICNLGLVAAVWALTKHRRTSRDVILAIVIAALASVSSSQGLLIWAAGLVAILCIPRARPQVASVWVIAGALVTTIVRHGETAAVPGHVGYTHVRLLAHYALLYLGAPVAGTYGLDRALAAGIISVLCAAFLAAMVLRAPLALRVRLAPWAALATYALLAAAVTAGGRAALGLNQALASRYTSIAAFGWIAFIAAALIVVPRTRRPLALAAFPVAAIVAASLVQSYACNILWRERSTVLRTATAELERADPAALPAVYPDLRRALALVRAQAEINDGMFRSP